MRFCLQSQAWRGTHPECALRPGVPVQVATVRRDAIRAYVEEQQARTRVPDIYQITMPLAGRVLPISLREGDQVAKGDVVARMDTR